LPARSILACFSGTAVSGECEGRTVLFEKISGRLSDTFRKLTGRGVISEDNIAEALREIRRALLEADVSFQVAKDFVKDVGEKARGEAVLRSLSPGQQVVKIVHDELVELLGHERSEPDLSGRPPLVYLLMGLQGSGKTTTAARLAKWLSGRRGKSVMLAACDLQRPAAIDQLEILAETAGAEFYADRGAGDPVTVLEGALELSKKRFVDVLIADTAGRLHVDDGMMEELERIRDAAEATEILLVLDGLSGQDAVNVAREFGERIGFTGAVLTKMDGDSRGGAALSFRAVTGRPVKFVGTGEGVDGLEPFDPERIAGRLLGMGDVLGLVEKAQTAYNQDEAVRLEKKLRTDAFTLEDFLVELRRVQKMGSLTEIFDMLPGKMKPAGAEVDPSDLKRMEAIISSMTPAERLRPEIINGSRRKRIARGSGSRVSDVNRLLSEFRTMKTLMKRIRSGKGIAGLFR
jgi:signal recognition particle subunit SRP54